MNLKQGVPYIVTKPSRNKELQVGDRIYLKSDGSLINKSVGGWFEPYEVELATVGMECMVDLKTIKVQAAMAKNELERIIALINEVENVPKNDEN